MQTLLVSAYPRVVSAAGTVTVEMRVDAARVQLALVAQYGAGLSEARQVMAAHSGTAAVRLRALAPAGCAGHAVVRVYVTATSGGRAITRATTFTVSCPAVTSTADQRR